MFNINNIPFFQTPLSIVHIDPNLYNKEEIVQTVLDNYSKSTYRNIWNDNSDLHHYFNDWSNPNYNRVDLTTILAVYDRVVKNFIDTITLDQNSGFKYKWNIVNITVYNQQQHMQVHDHFLNDCLYSAVHYLSVPDNHAWINFVNPLLALQYSHPTMEKFSKFLNNRDINNSTYFSDWDLNVKEDHMIIFPSYLRHKVKQPKVKSTDSKLRIGIVVNIDLD